MRIFTVKGTSSTCGHKGRERAHSRTVGGGRGGHILKSPGYLIHAPHNLLELGRAIHECTAATLWDMDTLVTP